MGHPVWASSWKTYLNSAKRVFQEFSNANNKADQKYLFIYISIPAKSTGQRLQKNVMIVFFSQDIIACNFNTFLPGFWKKLQISHTHCYSCPPNCIIQIMY